MILQYKRVTFWLITTKSQYFFNLTRQRLARFKNFQLLGSCIKIWCNFPTWPTDGGILLTLMIDLTCQRLDPSLDFHIYFSSSSIQFTILPQGLSGQLLSPNHEVWKYIKIYTQIHCKNASNALIFDKISTCLNIHYKISKVFW